MSVDTKLQAAHLRVLSITAGCNRDLSDRDTKGVSFSTTTVEGQEIVLSRKTMDGNVRRVALSGVELVALARLARLNLDAEADEARLAGRPPEARPGPLLPPGDSRKMTRREDPETSREAAQRVRAKLTRVQEFVLTMLRRAGPEGLTDLELEELGQGEGRSTLRSRRAELVEQGLAADSGHRREQAGSNRIVWIITEKGHARHD